MTGMFTSEFLAIEHIARIKTIMFIISNIGQRNTAKIQPKIGIIHIRDIKKIKISKFNRLLEILYEFSEI